MLFCTVCWPVNGQDKAPPKELVQYVQDAQKAGLNAVKIQENAVNAGWPAALVTEAIAQVRAMEKGKPADESAGKTTVPQSQQAPATAAEQPSSPAAPIAAAQQPAGHAETPQPTGVAAKVPADSPAAADAHQPGANTDHAGTVPTANGAKPAESSAAPAAEPGASGAVGAAGAKPAINPNAAAMPDDYEIGAGDILKITVWHEADASLPSVVVPPNGKISMPLLHDVEVAGMKVPDLEKSLTDRLSSFMTAPEVSVVVTGMNSKKIYMTGKVKREGPLAYTYRMTVMQALSEAGGLSDFARKKGIYILRTEKGRQFKLAFDYRAVLKGEHLETNVELMPGDMIVVP
jgi:polysaccharide export outer membrane protein